MHTVNPYNRISCYYTRVHLFTAINSTDGVNTVLK